LVILRILLLEVFMRLVEAIDDESRDSGSEDEEGVEFSSRFGRRLFMALLMTVLFLLEDEEKDIMLLNVLFFG